MGDTGLVPMTVRPSGVVVRIGWSRAPLGLDGGLRRVDSLAWSRPAGFVLGD
jgi:hypothetical protein